MPTYQYECQICSQNFEQRQSFKDSPLTDCPLCGTAGAVSRVISQVGVIFKGSGFYITDSKNSNKSNGSKSSAKSETPEPATAKTSESKVSESKTDT